MPGIRDLDAALDAWLSGASPVLIDDNSKPILRAGSDERAHGAARGVTVASDAFVVG